MIYYIQFNRRGDRSMTIKKAAPFLLLIVTIIWGSGFTASQAAIDGGLSAAFIMFGRFIVAALTIGVIFCKKLKHWTKQEILMSLTVGLILFFAHYTQTLGLEQTTPSKNAFLTATNVVMVPFLYWILARKQPGVKAFISAVICFAGICILSVDFSQGMVFGVGDLLSLLCALLFAGHIAVVGYFVDKMDGIKLAFGQLAGAAVFSTIAFLILDRDFSVIRPTIGVASVVYLGIFSTGVCFFLQTISQEHVSSTKASLILSLESVFGTLFSILLGYEVLKINMVLGGLMILVSIVFVEVQFKKGTKHAS